MSTGDRSESYEIAVAGGRYAPRVTFIPSNGKAVMLVVPGDPRRCYFEVWGGTGGLSVGQLLPVPDVPVGYNFSAVNAPLVKKWKDSPALCICAWYGSGIDPNGWLLIECLLTG